MKFKILILLSLIAIPLAAQKRHPLPSDMDAGDYSSSSVLVKVKPGHEGAVRTLGGRPLIHPKSLAQSRARFAPRQSSSGINLELYAEIPVRGTDVPTFINELNNTGHFDIVEPVFRNNIQLVPNDPFVSNQYYLDLIKAQQAWDLADGDGIVIGIVDSGGDLDHPDIADKIYIDPTEPVDGIDNNEDGYIDNYRGWDFMGADTLNLNDPDFIGDNDPSTVYGGYGSHGTNAAGCAAAVVSNGVGIAGVGYKAKLLFTKHSADNQGANNGGIYMGYSGLLYAATHGAKIINLSWGGSYRSQIIQDLISFVTLDLNCLVVASAGNDGSSTPFYPAAYEYVVSVAATSQTDAKANFSSYGSTVDISAPGVNVYSTTFNNTYTNVSGTSFSAPIVAGAAALVWSKFPDYTAVQVGQKLRVSADASLYSKNSSTLARKLGIGRLDVYSALTSTLPAVRASGPKLVNASGVAAEPGEDAFLTLDFTNYLSATSSNLQITVAPVVTSFVSIKKGTIRPGVISSGQKWNNKSQPFELKIASTIGTNVDVQLLITYSDGNYSDYEFISFLVNPTYLNIEENLLLTTVASNGRIGYENSQNGTNGIGFVYNDNSLLYEMGIMAGSSTQQLYNNVRGIGSNFDQDFTIIDKIKQILPGQRSSSETFGSFRNNQSPATVNISYRSLAWREVPYDQFVIMEYKIKNVSGQTLSNFSFGLFADWDITPNGQQDIARWDPDHKMGYIFPAIENTRPHAGVRILKGIAPIHYAIDNNQNTPGAPFGLYDGFTDQEKITTLSSGIGRTEAGATSSTGADVSNVIGAGPYTIAPNEEITVAFALMAADNLPELQAVANHADTVYNFVLTATPPIVAPVVTCYNSPATLQATGASSFKWYRDFTGGEPVAEGPTLTTGNLVRDTVLYVANFDQPYGSVRTKATVTVSSVPRIDGLGDGRICSNESITLTAAQSGAYLWSNGATTRSITVNTAGSYSVSLTDATLGCSTTTDPVTVVVDPSPTASFTISTPALETNKPIQFTNTSTGGTTYQWTFGNNKTSTDKDPTQTYSLIRNYTVSLTVTNEFGCTANTSQSISVITGLAQAEQTIRVFPNPTDNGRLSLTSDEPLTGRLILTGADGRTAGMWLLEGALSAELDIAGLGPGVYLLRVPARRRNETLRIIIR